VNGDVEEVGHVLKLFDEVETIRWRDVRSTMIGCVLLSGIAERLQGLEHVGIVAIDSDSLPDFGDFTLGVDQVGTALDAHTLFAVHVLFAPSTIFFGDSVIGVCQEWEVQ
jgi:hypothetical protein